MANAIKMILRCARYGAPAEYHDYGPETIDPVTDHLPEEAMGNGERLDLTQPGVTWEEVVARGASVLFP